MPDKLLERFRNYQQKHQLLPDNRRPTLVAASGGLDSTVLAHLFFEENLPFAIAHVNFKLRGDESDGDEFFTKNLAEKLGAAFFKTSFETKKEADAAGESIQMAARRLRLDWFEKIRSEQNFGAVALAHHLDDQIETQIFNLSRGASLAGLRGMLPRRDHFIRPLLFATRDEILDFAKSENIEWREDSSNATDDYSRNFVRHHIVPNFKKLNPDFQKTAARSVERLRQQELNLTYFFEKFLKENSRSDASGQSIFLKKEALQRLPAPEDLLNFYLKKHGFDSEQCRQIAENLEKQAGQIWQSAPPADWQLTLDRTEIILSKKTDALPPTLLADDDLMTRLPDGSQIFLFRFTPDLTPNPDLTPDPSPKERGDTISPLLRRGVGGEVNTIFVNFEKLEFPLVVRRWRDGDRFQPLGMAGQSKKVQDFLTDLKVSRVEKERQLVLENGDGALIWVIGRRADERFKIHPDDQNLLKITWL